MNSTLSFTGEITFLLVLGTKGPYCICMLLIKLLDLEFKRHSKVMPKSYSMSCNTVIQHFTTSGKLHSSSHFIIFLDNHEVELHDSHFKNCIYMCSCKYLTYKSRLTLYCIVAKAEQLFAGALCVWIPLCQMQNEYVAAIFDTMLTLV